MTFTGAYSEQCRNRVKFILDILGHEFFAGKEVLDLGGAQGDVSAAFSRLGSRVIVVDARKELLKVAASKFTHVKTKHVNLDTEWPFRSTDIIISLDLISHLKNWHAHLRNACNSAATLILQSQVLDSDDPNDLAQLSENRNDITASFSGFASIPSAANIERVMSECGMTFDRYDSSKLNSPTSSFDWKVSNSKAIDPIKHRFWIAHKSQDAGLSTPVHQMVSNPKYNQPGMLRSPEPTIPVPPSPFPSVAMPIYPEINAYLTGPAKSKQPRGRLSSAPVIEPPLRFTTRLFFPYYDESNQDRKRNMDIAFRRNIDNLMIDLVVVSVDAPPTFNELFGKINQLASETDISIIANHNVFFDRTMALAQNIKPRELYALSAWNYKGHIPSFDGRPNNQVAWVMKGKVNVDATFVVGEPGSDGKVALAFSQAGYSVSNPSRAIMAFRVGEDAAGSKSEMEIEPSWLK